MSDTLEQLQALLEHSEWEYVNGPAAAGTVGTWGERDAGNEGTAHGVKDEDQEA